MLNLEIIRQRCRELLVQAELENDEVKRKRILECEQWLREDDCFSNPRKRKQSCFFLFARLDFSVEEANEYYNYMEDLTEARGLLFRKYNDGREIPVETILNPEIEDYFQLGNGIIFKIRDEIEFYSLDSNGKWNRDGYLQRRFLEGDYERIRYQITQNKADQ